MFNKRLDNYGYGVFKLGGRNLGAHKISYILFNGDFDQKCNEVMHECHNRACINPAHLKVGTHKENMNYAETKQNIRASTKKNYPPGFRYNYMAHKKGQTILFGTTSKISNYGFSSGKISESLNGKRRTPYKGFSWTKCSVSKIGGDHLPPQGYVA